MTKDDAAVPGEPVKAAWERPELIVFSYIVDVASIIGFGTDGPSPSSS